MKAIVLLGPTGIGKTDISLKICDDNFEIVSADSVQVYRFLDIGSSKPGIEDRERIKHHLIDIVDPDYNFTAGDFVRYAKKACDEILEEKKYPFFIGGTAFYIDSFFIGLSEIPEINITLRDELKTELNERGLHALYDELSKCDKAFSDKIHSNDKQRILRGLEVYRGTGRPISSYYNNKIGYESRDTVYIGLRLDRNSLNKRIDQRVDFMIQSGFIDEIIHLRKMGFGRELKSMQSIGYLELNKYLDGVLKLDEAIEKIKTETKKYAKRQMTWFRRNKKTQWIESIDLVKIKNILNKLTQVT